MLPNMALRGARFMMRNSTIRTGVERLGIRRQYERVSATRNLAPPAISTDATYDRELGLLSLRGSWSAIGAELARVTPVADQAAEAKRFRGSLFTASAKALNARIDEAIDFFRARHTAIAEFLDGACQSLGNVDLRDVVLASAWPTLVQWREYVSSCSGMVWRNGAGTIFGQNLDVGASNNVAVAHIVPDSGPARLCHIMPGLLWLGTGVNEFGLTYGGGSVNVARAFVPSPASLPTCFTSMAVLDAARSVTQAEAVFKSLAPYGPNHDGISLVVADQSGAVSRVEATGQVVVVDRQDDAFAAAANHFEISPLHDVNRSSDDDSNAILDNSIARLESAYSTFSGRSRVNVEDFQRFLRSERGPGAWCRSAIAPDTGWTTASYTIDLGQARYHYWLGTRPAKPGWRTLDMEPLLLRRTYC